LINQRTFINHNIIYNSLIVFQKYLINYQYKTVRWLQINSITYDSSSEDKIMGSEFGVLNTKFPPADDPGSGLTLVSW